MRHLLTTCLLTLTTLVITGLPAVAEVQTREIDYDFEGTVSLQLAFSGADLDAAMSFPGNPAAPRPGEVEQITGERLVLHSAVDPFVKPEDITAFKAAMEAAGVPYEWVDNGGAVPSFTNPAAGDDPSTGAANQARAARRAWEAMRAFSREIFGR